jgi:hypothetical protein
MDQNAFITSQMPTYPAYQFLNDACPRGNLYALFDGRMSYYYRNGVFVGDCFGPARYSDVASAMTSGRTLYDKLKSFDIKYFLVNEEQKKFFKLPSDSFFTQHFIPLFKNKAVQLFVLTP